MFKSTAFFLVLTLGLLTTSCVGKKKYALIQTELETANKDLKKCNLDLQDYSDRLTSCNRERERLSQRFKIHPLLPFLARRAD